MSEIAPDWFTEALAVVPGRGAVELDGCEIAYRFWGSAKRPGLVLVHGGGAHSGWWDHIGPLLADDYRVVALDLSGHGDSGRRREYAMETWARETLAVAAADAMDGPIVIGHSMGGAVAFAVGADHSDSVAGVMVIDSGLRQAPPEDLAATEHTAFGPLRVYPTKEEAIARFRTVPDQPTSLPYVIAHIANASLRPTEGGWVWKFDPAIFARPRPGRDLLARITCRVALFRAEHGLMTPDIGAELYELLGRRAPVVKIALAWHHVMLDQPLSLVTGLRALLADWDHSDPRASLPA